MAHEQENPKYCVQTKFAATINNLKKLSEEFDTLGVPVVVTNNAELVLIVEQFVQSTHILIQMYRKKLKEIRNYQLNGVQQETVHLKLNKYLDNSESEIYARDDEIKNLKHQLFKMKCDLEEKNKLNKNLMVQLNQTKAAYKTKIKEQEHIVHHLKNEIERLKQKCGECLANSKTSDTFLGEYLLKYKNREEVYKETITKLQDNNRLLMEEVLNLKQDIVTYMCSDKTK